MLVQVANKACSALTNQMPSDANLRGPERRQTASTGSTKVTNSPRKHCVTPHCYRREIPGWTDWGVTQAPAEGARTRITRA